MMVRRMVVPVVLLAVAALGACGGQEPPPPAPAPVTVDTAAERMRREADERARREREEREARERAEADRRARDAANEAEIARSRSILAEVVNFDYDKSDIREDAREILTRKVAVLRGNPTWRVRISGHADERGSVEYNLALGQRRANATRDFLSGFGIDASRFEVVSLGEERPADEGHNEDAWARNRRAEFEILGGM